MIRHELGEQGPLAAGDTYRLLKEQIALDALIGRLPSVEDKARFYAAHEGIVARAQEPGERTMSPLDRVIEERLALEHDLAMRLDQLVSDLLTVHNVDYHRVWAAVRRVAKDGGR